MISLISKNDECRADQRSNIYNLVHEARYYTIFFFTKTRDVHQFSCTPQVFFFLLHLPLPQHISHVLALQEAHAEHSKHLLPPFCNRHAIVKLEKLCGAESKLFVVQLCEVRKEVLNIDLLMFAVEFYLFSWVLSHELLENDCIDVRKDVLVVLVFARIGAFFDLLLFLYVVWCLRFWGFGIGSEVCLLAGWLMIWAELRFLIIIEEDILILFWAVIRRKGL